MKSNSIDSDIDCFLRKFPLKSKEKQIVYGDKAVTYNRCSHKKQDSVGWQKKVTGSFVNEKQWKLIKSYGEKKSATTDDRKEFQEMLKFCEKEKISHIVFYSFDRFSRTGNMGLIDELRLKGIIVHSATQNVDDTSSGRFTKKMYLAIAELENAQRREKIIEGFKNKLRKGEWPTAPTIGYEKRYVTGKKEHDHDKKQCFINKDGELIRQAFLWKYNEKISNLKVQKRLESMGLYIPLPQLTRIFRNVFYCGYIRHSLLDEGEIIRGKHEPLISEEIFKAVNGISKPHGWQMNRKRDGMPLKESVTCEKCGRPLTAYIKKEKHIYYKCPNNGCFVNTTGQKLHTLFAAELSRFNINPQLFPVINSQLEATYSALHKNEIAREKPMKDELTRLKNELEAMEFNLATSKISPDLFQKYSTSHMQKISEIESELGNVTKNSSNLELFLDTACNFASNLFKMWQLLDSDGKVRLQKLVYPDGLVYNHENRILRTPRINLIFSAITSISQNTFAEKSLSDDTNSNELHQLYLMFSSSNFFWDNLLKIQDQMDDIKNSYPDVWQNVFYKQKNPLTGAAEIIEFNYNTTLTETMAISNNRNENLPWVTTNIYTGITSHFYGSNL